MGASRSTRPSWAATMAAVAVKDLDMDWIEKRVEGVTGIWPVPIGETISLGPQDALVIHDHDCQTGNVIQPHLLRNFLLVFGDYAGDAIRNDRGLSGGQGRTATR